LDERLGMRWSFWRVAVSSVWRGTRTVGEGAPAELSGRGKQREKWGHGLLRLPGGGI